MRRYQFVESFNRKFATFALLICAFAVSNAASTCWADGFADPFEGWRDGVDGELLRGVSYGADEWNKLDLFVPKEIAPEKSRAAFVFVHGGSWTGGKRDHVRHLAERAAKSGYIAATIDYMLYGPNTTGVYSMTKVMDEVEAAIVKVKELAADRGVELDRVALGGDSAGGHIVSLYAYSRGKTSPLPVAFISPRVAPIDFHVDAWKNVHKPAAVGGVVALMTRRVDAVPKIMLGSKDESLEELIGSISPLAYLSEDNFVPTVTAYGAKDQTIGSGHCELICKRFGELNARSIEDVAADEKDAVVFDCVEFPNSGHMLSNDPERMTRFYALILKYADRYLKTDK